MMTFHSNLQEIALGTPVVISLKIPLEENMVKKICRGEPGGTVKVILPSGNSRPLRHVVLHSPTGFGLSEAAAMAALGRPTWR